VQDFLNQIEFAEKWWFALLAIPVVMLVWYLIRYKKNYPTIQLSTIKGVRQFASPLRGKLKHLLFVFRILALAFLVLALARPQKLLEKEDVTTEGIDIVMALDISSSMLARDFDPNRLKAAKSVAKDFIKGRPNDRIGLTVFAGESFTQCPATTDHRVLINLMEDVEDGMVEDGTAIGMGLANAINRLKENESDSKVIILLTDGVNNAGNIDPITAAEAAIQHDIRIYSIGVGTKGKAPYPFNRNGRTVTKQVDVKIDEELMKEVADMTNGKYFRATDKQSLKNIYRKIDQLEKSKIEVTSFRRRSEEFYPFALIAFGLIIGEVLLRYTVERSIP
jgi:Ca-activated chloride channel family protein